MLCARCRTKLEDYLAGRLPEPDAAMVAAHLGGCEACRAHADELRAIPPLAAAARDWTTPVELARTVSQRAATERRGWLALALGHPRPAPKPLARRLWLALLLTWVALAVAPLTRPFALRLDLVYALRVHRPAGLVSSPETGLLAALAIPGGVPRHTGEAVANQVDEAWAHAAVAEGNVVSPHWEQAIRLAPNDESIRLRYAVHTLQGFGAKGADENRRAEPDFWAERRQQYLRLAPLAEQIEPDAAGNEEAARAQRADAATAELVRRWPDNGYAWYLRAVALLEQGDLDGCRRALRRGGAAPRFETGRLIAVERVAQLHRARGLAPALAEIEASSALLFPELSAFRQLTRDISGLAWRDHVNGNARASVAADLLLVRLGGRLRDEGETIIDRLVGVAVQGIAMGAKSGREKPPREIENDESARLRWYAERQVADFSKRLRAAGRAELIPKIEAEAKRSVLVKEACRQVNANNFMVGPVFDQAATTMARWFGFGVVCVLQALLLGLLSLVSAVRRRGRPTGAPAPAEPGAFGFVLLITLVINAWYCRWPGMGGPPDGWLVWGPAVVVAPLVVLVGILWLLGGAYARRAGAPRWRFDTWLEWLLEAGPWTTPPRLDYLRRAARGALGALVPALLIAALLVTVPLARHTATLTGAAEDVWRSERERVQQCLVTMHPPSGEQLLGPTE